MATAQRERILTDNEKYGGMHLDEDAPGGVWLVFYPKGELGYVATNRQAAEDALYAKAREGRISPDGFSIQVWQAQDQYPAKED